MENHPSLKPVGAEVISGVAGAAVGVVCVIANTPVIAASIAALCVYGAGRLILQPLLASAADVASDDLVTDDMVEELMRKIEHALGEIGRMALLTGDQEIGTCGVQIATTTKHILAHPERDYRYISYLRSTLLPIVEGARKAIDAYRTIQSRDLGDPERLEELKGILARIGPGLERQRSRLYDKHIERFGRQVEELSLLTDLNNIGEAGTRDYE